MDNYKNFNTNQKTEFWSKHFKSWIESGLSQKKYCTNNELSYWSFRSWYYKNRPEKTECKFIRIYNINQARCDGHEKADQQPGIKFNLNRSY